MLHLAFAASLNAEVLLLRRVASKLQLNLALLVVQALRRTKTEDTASKQPGTKRPLAKAYRFNMFKYRTAASTLSYTDAFKII